MSPSTAPTIQEIRSQVEKLGGEITNDLLAEYLLLASVYLGNMGADWARAEQRAYQIKANWLDDPKMSDARAETIMKASPEYLAYRTKRLEFESTLELINSFKSIQRVRLGELQNIPS